MENSAFPLSSHFASPDSVSSAPLRILLLIESANTVAPSGEEPRAKVLRADQLSPDQKREMSRYATNENSAESSTQTASNGVSTYANYVGVNGTNAPSVAEDSRVGSALPPPEDVTPAGCGDGIEILERSLHNEKYKVQVLGSDLSSQALHRVLNEETRPDIVILEASRDVSVVAARCHDLKNEVMCGTASLLVVLPPAFYLSPNAPQTLAQLTVAGADDFSHCDAPVHEFQARLHVLGNLARTRSELQQTQEKLRTLLQTDDLTQVLSRRFFFQMAHREYHRALHYGHDLSCLMIAVNYFRRITETMGFACSDAVLRHVAHVVRDVTRDVDTVARFAEEKFVVLLPESNMATAQSVGERIQSEVANRAFVWQGNTLPLSVSVGEATQPGEPLINNASDSASQELDEYSNAAHGFDNNDISLDEADSFSLHEALSSLLEEADATLFVAKRGMRNNWMETPLASPLSQTQ